MTAFERAEKIAAQINHVHRGPNDPCVIRDMIMWAIHEEKAELSRALESAQAELDTWKATHSGACFSDVRDLRLQVGEWKERSEAWEASCREIAKKADRVMKALEEHGPSIVPHLMDTDDNDGEFLRREIRFLCTEKRDGEKPRICEDCGKKDASVARACFKAGRGYLCHDCDR